MDDLLKKILGIGNNLGDFLKQKKNEILNTFTPKKHSPISTPKLQTYTPTPAPKIKSVNITAPKLSQPSNNFLTNFFKQQQINNVNQMNKGLKTWAKVVPNVVTKTIPSATKSVFNYIKPIPGHVKTLGKELGKSKVANMDQSLIAKQIASDKATMDKNMALALKLKGQGNIAGYQKLLQSNTDIAKRMQEYTSKNLTKTNVTAEQGKKDIVKAGVDVAKDTAYLYGAKVLKNPVSLAVGGTLGGFLNKAFGGKDPYKAAGLAIGEMPKYESVANVTDAFLGPAIAKAKGILSNPAAKQAIGRTLSGLNSVIQNEIVSKMDKKDPTSYENLLAFGMGAILSSGGNTKEWDSLSKDTKDLIEGGGKKLGLDMRPAGEVWVLAPNSPDAKLPNFLYESKKMVVNGDYPAGLSVKAKGGTANAEAAKNAIEFSKAHQTGLIDAMKGSETQDEAVAGIKQYLDDQIAELSKNPDPKAAKGLRAAINRTMYNLADVAPENGKINAKMFAAAFNNPEISQALQTLEGYKSQVDDVIAGNIKKTATTIPIEKNGQNLMEIENGDLTLPELKKKLEIAIEGNDDPDLIMSIQNDITQRGGEISNITDKPIKIFRAEDSTTGVSAVANGTYFAETKDLAKQYGNVISEDVIPKGSKILNFDALKNKPDQTIIPQEIIQDPNKLAIWAKNEGYNYIKNTNTKGVEYVQISKDVGNWIHDSGGAIPGEPLAWTKDNKVAVLETGDGTGKFSLNTSDGKKLGIFNSVQDAINSYEKSNLNVQPQSEVKPQTTGARKAEDILKEIEAGTYKPRTKAVQATEIPENIVPGEPQLPSRAQQPSIPKERGFVTSVKESPNITEQTKTDVTGTYVPKTNPELMGEAQALLNEGASIKFKSVEGLDKKIVATIQEAINLDKAGQHEAAANLFNNLSEHGTELGRGVKAFSMIDQMTPEAISLSAAGKIKAYNRTATRPIPELTGDQVKTISDQVSKIDGLTGRDKNIAINELQDTINNFIPSSLVDKAITVWKAGLLTSLRTHERNLLGNTIMEGSEVAKDLPATFADKIMALKTGKRSMTFTTQGTVTGAKKGVQAFKDIITTGYDPEDAISKYDVKSITWGKTKVEQALKKYTDVVFRTLAGADKPFWNSSFARSLYDQAGAEAINAGKQGDSAFIENIVKNPTEEMLKAATIDANTATFHDKNVLSSIANAVKRAAKDPKLKWGAEVGKVITEVLMPFTGVPSSIVGKTIAYSPIGLINGSIKVGRVLAGQVPELQRQAAQEVGRGVIGTGLFGLGAYLMDKGLMTGQPKDAKEADLWAAQGKQANSVMIGGKWRSINSVGPQNLVMLAGAKYQEEMGKPDGSLGAYGAKLVKDQLNQTFLAGVQQPLNAITDPARYGKSYVGNESASLIPNIVKDASKSFDSNVRENNTVIDYLKSSIPGLRNTLIPKRDVLGNEIKQEPTGAGAFFDLFNSKTPIDNVTVNELARLAESGNEATPSRQTATQTIRKEKIKLTFEQLNQLEKGVGEALKPQLETLIQSDTYQSLADDAKANAIDNLVKNVRTKYKNINGMNLTAGNLAEPGGITPTNQGYSYVDDQGNYKEINIQKVADMPEKSRYEKTLKEKAAYKIVDDILDNLPEDQQSDALAKIGMDATAASYYNVARQADDAKYSYILDLIDNNGANRQQMMSMLVQGRATINNKMLVSNAVVDDLYNDGYISSAERTALKKITLDSQGKQTKASATGGAKAKKFTMDKVPDINQFVANSKTQYQPMKVKPLNADFFVGPQPKIPKPEVLKIEDLIGATKASASGITKAKQIIAKMKQKSSKAGLKLSKSFFSGNRKQS